MLRGRPRLSAIPPLPIRSALAATAAAALSAPFTLTLALILGLHIAARGLRRSPSSLDGPALRALSPRTSGSAARIPVLAAAGLAAAMELPPFRMLLTLPRPLPSMLKVFRRERMPLACGLLTAAIRFRALRSSLPNRAISAVLPAAPGLAAAAAAGAPSLAVVGYALGLMGLPALRLRSGGPGHRDSEHLAIGI